MEDDLKEASDLPDWVVAEYRANGPQPYLLRLMKIFTDIDHRKMVEATKDHGQSLSSRA